MNKVKAIWNGLPESVKHVLHTAWQVTLPVLLTHLYLVRSTADVKALVVVVGATFLAAVKAAVVGRRS